MPRTRTRDRLSLRHRRDLEELQDTDIQDDPMPEPVYFIRCCLGFLLTEWQRPPVGDIPGALKLVDRFGGDGRGAPGFTMEEAKRQAKRVAKSQITKVDIVTASGDTVFTVPAPETF